MIEGQEGVSWEQWLALARACEESGIESLFRTDLDLKRSAGDLRVLIERLIVELCVGKRVARRW